MRLHGRLGVLGIAALAACVGAGAGAAPAREARAGAAGVRPGIDVLLSDSAHLVRSRRVGLVANQASVDARGVHDVERLRAAGMNLVALFGPEHGFRGTADPGATVASSTDSATGLPIYSLYGRSSAPTPAMLEGVDVLLVDLQDVGARYYTYLWTTVEVMRAAARAGVPVVVLDRPNPLGGAVQGNLLDTAYRSPVGLLAVPMRHGMTLGELARLARHDLGLGADLTVVPASGWRREQLFDQTGLPFRAPSLNLPTLESLLHYPGLCLFEGTALSVGRGSDAPFEQIGAPWLDTAAVLARVRAARLPGVEFRGVTFTPSRPGDAKYSGITLAGIRLRATDRTRYDPTVTAVALLAAVQAVHPDRIGFNSRQFDRLAGGDALRRALLEGRAAADITGEWGARLAEFRLRRQPFLLY